jgi:hypothetical protein
MLQQIGFQLVCHEIRFTLFIFRHPEYMRSVIVFGACLRIIIDICKQFAFTLCTYGKHPPCTNKINLLQLL